MIFGNLGNFGALLKQAKQLKDEMGKARYEGESGGVRVVISGEMEILELKISPESNFTQVEESTKKAINQALKAAKNDLLKKLTGGFLPPGPSL